MTTLPTSIDALQKQLQSADYLADRELATTLFLALKLKRPVFLEGDAGVGKTEVAKALATALQRPLLRLQCYEGLDLAQAAYEWNVQRQLLAVRARDLGEGGESEALERSLYDERFLIKRALLQAIEPSATGAPVLLIDELDRADAPFEAYLLEFLAEFQITIPELGVVRAAEPPVVVLTSNRTREVHDAVKRRCLYHWVDYPSLTRELAIVRQHLPGVGERLSLQVARFIQRLRQEDLFKRPGVAETIEWTRALTALDVIELSPDHIRDTLGVLLKYQDDIAALRTRVDAVLSDAQTATDA